MAAKSERKDAQQLMGAVIGTDLTEAELVMFAQKLGYRTVQIRTPDACYDCMYDTTRLLVYADHAGAITRVMPG